MGRDRSPLIRAADIFMLAGATEMMQLYVNGRTASFGDLLLDCTGGAVGALIFYVPVQFATQYRGKGGDLNHCS